MPLDGMDMTMMLTRAGEVDSLAVIELTAESALGLEPSGVSVPDIQHSDSVQMGPTPMNTVCYCEVSHDIGVLRNLTPDSMWLACHRSGTWIYGRCQCEKEGDNVLQVAVGDAMLSDSQTDASVIIDLVTINPEGAVRNTVWRVSTSLILELCKGLKWEKVLPIDLREVHSDYWEMSQSAFAEFARMVERQIPSLQDTNSGDEVVLLSKWPEAKTTPQKESLIAGSLEVPASTVAGQSKLAENGLKSLNINEVRPIDVSEMAGRLASWADSSVVDSRKIIQYPKSPEKIANWIRSLTRRGIVRRLRFPKTPTQIRLALEDRLKELMAACSGIHESSRYTETAPPNSNYRPRTLIAMALGSVNKTATAVLLDSGSGISVVSREFADKHLADCKTYAYDGPGVQVADKSPVKPIGYIDADVRVGSNTRYHRFTVFPTLPVDVLLGTDWLYACKAVTDWGRQLLTFPGCPKSVPIKILQHQTQSKLHVISEVILPPRSGKWVRVEVSGKDRIRMIPRATVYSTSDPWCAKHRGIITPNALITLDHGKTAVFLVNTLSRPMRVKKRNTVAYALPDVPEDDLIVPMDDTLYDLAPLKVGG